MKKVMMNTMNTMSSNVTVKVGNMNLSTKAFMEFDKLRNAYEKHEDIFNNWDVNPFFHIALYNYYMAIGLPITASNLKEQIMRHGYYIDKGISVYNLFKRETFTVNVEVICNGNVEISEYVDEAAWEVLKDLSLKVVLNYK
jgi:hypothetical protein